jgi:hypothetical protein
LDFWDIVGKVLEKDRFVQVMGRLSLLFTTGKYSTHFSRTWKMTVDCTPSYKIRTIVENSRPRALSLYARTFRPPPTACVITPVKPTSVSPTSVVPTTVVPNSVVLASFVPTSVVRANFCHANIFRHDNFFGAPNLLFTLLRQLKFFTTEPSQVKTCGTYQCGGNNHKNPTPLAGTYNFYFHQVNK